MKKDFIKKLAEQLSSSIPEHLATLKSDFEKNCQQILSATFKKLDLVTREEFEVQRKVLLRTRKKLDELEEELAKMHQKLSKKKS